MQGMQDSWAGPRFIDCHDQVEVTWSGHSRLEGYAGHCCFAGEENRQT